MAGKIDRPELARVWLQIDHPEVPEPVATDRQSVRKGRLVLEAQIASCEVHDVERTAFQSAAKGQKLAYVRPQRARQFRGKFPQLGFREPRQQLDPEWVAILRREFGLARAANNVNDGHVLAQDLESVYPRPAGPQVGSIRRASRVRFQRGSCCRERPLRRAASQS